LLFIHGVFLALGITVLGFAMWRILAQKFNRITAVEPCTNVSNKHFSRHIAKPTDMPSFFI
jgi:hypothetical protein